MEATRIRWIAWGGLGISLALAAASVVFLVLARDTAPPPGTFGFRGFAAVFAVVFGIVGALIASRQPSNPIGWLFLGTGAFSGFQEAAQQYAIWSLQEGGLPGGAVAASVPTWGWVPATGTVVLALLLFPDGRLRSPRWRIAVALLLLGVAAATAGLALAPGRLENFRVVENPFGIEGARDILVAVVGLGMLAYMVAIVAAAGSLALRFRSARGEERLQMKWVVLAAGLMALSLASSFTWTIPMFAENIPNPVENLVVLSFATVPVAMGVAILRYRLYDIDVVIKKTVVYAILALLVFGVGGVVVWGGTGFVFGVARSDDAILVAGIVIGFLVWPLRQLALRIADRLVFGRRATPYQVLTQFSGRVAETYATEDVLERMARVLAEGIGAASATVWLRIGNEFRSEASWPADALHEAELPPSAIEVRHQGDVLGALSVRTQPNDPMTPAKERLIRDLAAQAGLVLRNAALIEDLKGSRQRLVAAQDQERRRIERNIHDGAQQQLVALAVKLRLADSLVGRDEGRAREVLAELHSETTQALEDLRDLARGIYPPLLADKGLAAALESQARKSPVPVAIETDGIGRYPQETEAAVYFSCLEALQNVAKYAQATSATVRLSQTDETLTFEISDDGRGFDPAAASRGTGLKGIADRLAALGGELEVRAAPGTGTTIAGSLPLEVCS